VDCGDDFGSRIPLSLGRAGRLRCKRSIDAVDRFRKLPSVVAEQV
jgi:hypothetical protein